VSKAVVVLEDCDVCALNNVTSINRDFIQKRNIREIIGRNKIAELLPHLESKDIRETLMIHFRDHYTTTTSALANHMIQKEAIELKNTVVENNFLLDQIDEFSTEVLDRFRGAESDTDSARFGKIYSDLLKRKLDGIAVLHKISGKEKKDEITGAMMTSYFDVIAKKLGQERVAEIKKESRSKQRGSRVDFVVEDIIDIATEDDSLNKVIKDIRGDEDEQEGE